VLHVAVLAALIAGCGSSDAAPSGDDSDLATRTLACLSEAGVSARLAKENEISVAPSSDSTYIKFSLTAGEAEALQFKGRAEGSEQIGSALLWVKLPTRGFARSSSA
jgi:hypothetical protein